MKYINKIYKYIFCGIVLSILAIANISTASAQGPSATLGIDCSDGKLTNGQCKYNFNEMLGKKINPGEENSLTDPVQFLQDIFLTATMFISVLASIGLIYSGYLYIMAGADTKKTDQANKGFRYSLIGLLITIFSVVIVRLIQFLASGRFGA